MVYNIRAIGISGVSLAFLAACISACGLAPDADFIENADRRSAPDIVAPSLSGDTFNLTDYQGKVVLLNFWATACPPCDTERPLLNELQQTYRDRGLVIVGIALDRGGMPQIAEYLESQRVGFRIVLGDTSLSDAFGGLVGVPVSMFVDKEGRLAASFVGRRPRRSYEEVIARLL